MAMKKRCLQSGCSVLVAKGSYCRTHQAARDRRYHNPVYQANRDAVLRTSLGECQCKGCGVCDGDCTRLATTADHILPLDIGGTSDLSNLRALCVNCNSSKKNRLL